MFCKALRKDIRCGELAEYGDHCYYHYNLFSGLRQENKNLTLHVDSKFISNKYMTLEELNDIFYEIELLIQIKINYRNVAYAPEFHETHNPVITMFCEILVEVENSIRLKLGILQRLTEKMDVNFKGRIMNIIKYIKTQKIESNKLNSYYRQYYLYNSTYCNLLKIIRIEIYNQVKTIELSSKINKQELGFKILFLLLSITDIFLNDRNFGDAKMKFIELPNVDHDPAIYDLKIINKVLIYNKSSFWLFMKKMIYADEKYFDCLIKVGVYRESNNRYIILILHYKKKVIFNPLKIDDWIRLRDEDLIS